MANDSGDPTAEQGKGPDGEALADRLAQAEKANAELKKTLDALERRLAGLERSGRHTESPVSLFKTALAEGEIQRIFQEAAQSAAESSLKAQLDRRVDRMRDEVRRGIDRASRDISSTLKGTIEGRVVAAVSGITHTKEFREILREITMWSASQAIKDKGGPILEEMKQTAEASLRDGLRTAIESAQSSLKPLIRETLDEYTRSEAFTKTLTAAAAVDLKTSLNEVLGADGGDLQGMVERLISEKTEPLKDTLTEHVADMETLAEALGKIEGGVSEKIEAVLGDFTSSEQLDARILEIANQTAQEALLPLKDTIGRAFDQQMTDLGKRLDEMEKAGAGPASDVLAGMETPEHLDDRIRKVTAEGIKKMAKRNEEAISELAQRVKSMLEKERETFQGVIRKSLESQVLPLTKVLEDVDTPAKLDEKIKALAAAETQNQGISEKALKALLEKALFQEKVKSLAAAERRDARQDILDAVEEALTAKGITEEGIPEEAIARLVDEHIAKALSGVKALAKKIQPVIQTEVGKELREQTKNFATLDLIQEEVAAAVEGLRTELLVQSENAGPGIDAQALREELTDAIRGEVETLVEKAVKSRLKAQVKSTVKAYIESDSEVQKVLKKSFGPESLTEAVESILQSDLFARFLNSDEMKEILDDKFKIMRNWLKNEELPRQFKKLSEGT